MTVYHLVLVVLIGGACGSAVGSGDIFGALCAACAFAWVMFGPRETKL